MKLYYSKGACSLVIRILIHEMNINIEFESVDLKTKKTESGADFLKISGKGGVPVLLTDDSQILTENVVIQQYLADKYQDTQLLPPINDFKRYRVLEWDNYISTELHKGFGPLFHFNFSQEVKESFFIPAIESKLKYINEQLENKKFLLGDDFTLPDAYLCVILLWCNHFKINIAQWPKLASYSARLKQRESVIKAFKEEGLPL